MSSDKVRILVVDDLPEKLLVYRVILEELGEDIICARSGSEALKQVLQHDFAVILLDVNMPDMDGLETAALIRQRRRSAHTPIIFITAFADEMRTAEGYAHGAVDYILAPVVPEVLRAKVKVFVDLFRMGEQVRRRAEEQVVLAEERSMRAAAEEANRRLCFLARVGATLAQSLDYEVTLRTVLKLAVPTLADKAVLIPSDVVRGNLICLEAGADNDGEAHEQTGMFCELPPAHGEAVVRVLERGMVEMVVSPNARRGADPATIVLPLRARGRMVGALVLSREPSGRAFDAADLTMVEAFAGRASLAMENSRLYRDLELADRQKNDFLSMLAHELRNPLAPIRSAVAVLRCSGEDQEDAQRAYDVIDRQVTHLVRLVDDLLDVSRITRGKIQVKKERIDVSLAVATALEISRPHLEALSHRLNVRMPQEPLLVEGDHARLSQVLANLLNNAAKFTPPGGSIWLSAARDGDEVVLTVRDDGIGISPDMLTKVFDLFTQVDHSLARSHGGLGVGLTLVQRIVEMHGGQVTASSEGPGRGSEFTVRLPALSGLAETERFDENSGPRALAAGAHRILVVDDNVDAADSLAWLLRLSGHETRTEYNGLAAIEAARTFRPKSIVLDLGLPGLDGYSVARRLRDDPQTRSATLIALSGYGRDEDCRRSSEAGFDHHFIKPVNVNLLLELLAGNGADYPADAVPQVTSAS